MATPIPQKPLAKSDPPIAEGVSMIYETTYKKGNLLQKLHFKFDGTLSGAIAKVKQFCFRHHLMHIHTVPFLVNLDEPSPVDSNPSEFNDVIDIEQ